MTLNLSGTYSQKPGIRPPSCTTPRQLTIYVLSGIQTWDLSNSIHYATLIYDISVFDHSTSTAGLQLFIEFAQWFPTYAPRTTTVPQAFIKCSPKFISIIVITYLCKQVYPLCASLARGKNPSTK